jgi:glycosyltransferase involved in cell wall biosynthesis
MEFTRRKVLILTSDIYNKIGGGEKVYRGIIKDNPEVDFFFFSSRKLRSAELPSNAFEIPLIEKPILDKKHIRDRYKSASIKNTNTGLNDNEINAAELAEQYASSAKGMQFDIIDIPEYEILGHFIRSALRTNGVKYGLIGVFIHGSLSATLEFEGKISSSAVDEIRKLEESQRYVADFFFTLNSWYPEKLGINPEKCHELSPWLFVEKNNSQISSISDDSATKLAFFGRWEKRKGVDLLPPLIKLICHRKIGLILGGKKTDNLRLFHSTVKACNQRDIELTISSTIDAEEFYGSLSSKDILVIPSRFDSFNLVALEAIVEGRTVAISTQTGAYQFLKNNHPEIYFLEFDPKDLVKSSENISNHLLRVDTFPNFANQNMLLCKDSIEKINRDQYTKVIDSALENQVSEFPPFDEGLIFKKFSIKRKMFKKIRQFQIDFQILRFLHEIKSNALKNFTFFNLNFARFFLIFLQSKPITRFILRKFKPISKNVYSRPISFLQSAGDNGSTLARRVTYGVRSLRLSGYRGTIINGGNLVADLMKLGLNEESKALELILTDESSEEVFKYLERRRVELERVPSFSFGTRETLYSRAYVNNPKISVIVSCFNGATKLPTFLSRLSLCPEFKDGKAELILIDANSHFPDAEIALRLSNDLGISARIIRVNRRITIQEAWNFGVTKAKGEYLSFLGVDETIYPDALTQLSSILESDLSVDWVMGNSVVTEVGPEGEYLNDLMFYDRNNADIASPFLETCYVSYVAGMYRRDVHERFGYYDPSFRGAGDTEFKSRVLPSLKVSYIGMTLGEFLNYPEIRTTATERIELEDIRAWYIFRTPGGLDYQASIACGNFLENIGELALGYRKSYCAHISTDIEIASALYRLARNGKYSVNTEVFRKLQNADETLKAMRIFLGFGVSRLKSISFFHFIQLAKWFDLNEKKSAVKGARRVRLDNMFEQHIWYW